MTDQRDADRELSRLYKKTPDARSPASLDRVILAKARAEAPAGRSFQPSWLPLASACAVVGLTFMLLYQTTTPDQPFDRADLAESARPELSKKREKILEQPAKISMQADRSTLNEKLSEGAGFSAAAAPGTGAATKPDAGLDAPLAMLAETAADEEGPPGELAQQIAEIEVLLERNRPQQALEAYQAYRKRWPDTALPEPLLERLNALLPEASR